VRIVELVAAGLPDREIARRLHLSPHTVSHHVGRLSEQVGARNRTALAAWAGAHGLYQPEQADEPAPGGVLGVLGAVRG
jgi:DNA-binding NarL/FixJ family response regulator